ncbi:MAG: Ulp1 family isopeptidase [Flavobacterium sp.]|uniref:Ulp1 family isopeptidase n=1 Tax=Flavobacterium sp. TaxID=239 RepID=UPI003BE99B64
MRPRRLYKENGKYFYLVNGKRKYIKVPENISDKQMVKINLKTLEKLISKRIKPRKKRQQYKFEKPIVNGDIGKAVAINNRDLPYLFNYPSASSAFVQQEKPITQISDILTKAKVSQDASKGFTKLLEYAGKSMGELFKGANLIEDSKRLRQTVAPDTTSDNIQPPPPLLEDVIDRDLLKTLQNPDDIMNLWETASGNGYDIDSNRQGYKTFLNRYIDSLELDEDNAKKLFLRFKGNQAFENMYYDNLLIGMNNVGSSSSSSSLSYLTTPTSSSASSTPKKPFIPTGNESKEDTRKGESKEAGPSKELKAYVRANPPKKPFLPKSAGDLMPSNRIKPLSVDEKLAATPSYSAATSGTESPAAPLSSKLSAAPIDAVNIAQIAREELINSLPPEAQAAARVGFGNASGEGLYNDEIASLIRKRVGRVIPVIPSDQVNDLMAYVKKGDKKFAAVINTNPSTSDGSGTDGYRPGHWRAIFINAEDDYPSVEYFDPLAEGKPEQSLINVMKKLCKKMNPEKMCLYKQNNLRRQTKTSSTCGWHSMQFIDDRWHGVPWSEATGYDNYIEQHKQPADDSKDGENDVKKYIKKYNVYL